MMATIEDKDALESRDVEYWVNKGNALSESAKNKQDESLFKSAFEKYGEAIKLDITDTDKASIFHKWGNAISDLAYLKQDEFLFKSAFEKYGEAIKLYKENKEKASAYCHWGIAFHRLAEINLSEESFKDALEKYKEAENLDQSNPFTFYNWGNILYRKAKIKYVKNKQDEYLFKSKFNKYNKDVHSKLDDIPKSLLKEDFEKYDKDLHKLVPLLEESFEKYKKAKDLYKENKEKATACCNWGIALYRLARIKPNDVSLFKDAFEKYEITTNLDENNNSVFFYWGLALLRLAKIKYDDDFQENFEIFEKCSEKNVETDTLFIKGELYFVLNQKEKAKDCFIKSKNDILEILNFLDEENREKIINEPEIIPSLLDSEDTWEGKFFKEVTKDIPKEEIEAYKKVYIRSIFIISLLCINNQDEKYEKLVAYYCKKNISQKLLFGKDLDKDPSEESKLRLNAIGYSNDPTEGKTLLDFLYGKGEYKTDEELNSKYKAFGSSFTFNYDSLNQFRLYGKEENKEGTGLSLVFRDSFFSQKSKMDFESPKKDSLKMEIGNSINEDKSPLFRCIYIDPDTDKTKQPIVTVGQKEENLFYRDKIEEWFEGYNNKIDETIQNVRDRMKELRTSVKYLKSEVVGSLLINLRYLTKHIAFKDEQECRIVKIRPLNDCEIKNDLKRLYIEYSPKVSNHIDKIYFGPKAGSIELFENKFRKKKLDIHCEKSKNPLA